MNRNQVEETRQKIDAEIAQLRVRIAELSFTRNSLAPIFSLPTEVIANIFVKARDEGPSDGTMSKTMLIISWVCRSWKDITTECSTLWSEIDTLHPETMDAFLQRSKQAHLGIKLRDIGEQNEGCVEQVLLHLSRIQSLSLDCTNPPRMFTGWATSAPVLTTLRLKGVTLPADSLSEASPSIRTLILESCLFVTLPIAPNLVNLTIRSPYAPLSANSLVSILNQLPYLACLTLTEALSIFLPSIVTTPLRISLPSITSVHIVDESIAAVTFFLISLEVPSNAKLEISCQCMSAGGTVDQLLEAYSSRNPITQNIPFLRVVRRSGLTRMETKAAAPAPDSTQPRACYLELNYGSSYSDPQLLIAASPFFDFNTVEELQISDVTPRVSSTFWKTLFGDSNMINLRTLEVSGYAAYNLGKHLALEGQHVHSFEEQDGQQAIQDSDQPELMWPNLRSLKMFFPKGSTSIFISRFIKEGWFVKDLELRVKYGIGLTDLTLKGWPMTESSLEQITAVVSNVCLYDSDV